MGPKNQFLMSLLEDIYIRAAGMPYRVYMNTISGDACVVIGSVRINLQWAGLLLLATVRFDEDEDKVDLDSATLGDNPEMSHVRESLAKIVQAQVDAYYSRGH